MLQSCGKSAPAALTTAPRTVASVTISPDTVTLAAGSSLELIATLRDAQGHPITNVEPLWRSSSSGVVQVSTKGKLRALSFGMSRIDASADGQGGYAVVTVPPPAPEQPITNCPIFPYDNIWNRDIAVLHTHPMSTAWVAALVAGKNLYVGFAPGTYGMQYTLIGSSTPRVSIAFSQDPSHCDPGPYPFTATTPIEVGTIDRHAFMIDTTTHTLYELYAADWNNGHPRAGAGVVFPLTSNALRADGWWSADDAGLPIFPGVVRWDEVLSGSITHALRFEAAANHINGTIGAHLWPARHDPHANSPSDGNLPPLGARFRLKISYSIWGFDRRTQVILRALQHYGMYLSDIGYDWELIGTADPRWDKKVIDELQMVPASAFEVVNESQLMIDPNSAQSLPPQP
jgi:hypothetical protein